MPFFPSLPEDAGVRTMWEAFNPEGHKALGLFSRSFMRNEGKLTPADKEMIAAYSSLLNESRYCYAGHSRVAINLGTDPGVFDPLVANIDTAPVRDDLKPLLKFIRILTLTPAKVTKADADAVFAARWTNNPFTKPLPSAPALR